MKKKKRQVPIRVVAIRVTKPELEQLELIKEKRRINSYSHALRVLIAEEAEKILNSATISSVNANCSTSA